PDRRGFAPVRAQGRDVLRRPATRRLVPAPPRGAIPGDPPGLAHADLALGRGLARRPGRRARPADRRGGLGHAPGGRPPLPRRGRAPGRGDPPPLGLEPEPRERPGGTGFQPVSAITTGWKPVPLRGPHA